MDVDKPHIGHQFINCPLKISRVSGISFLRKIVHIIDIYDVPIYDLLMLEGANICQKCFQCLCHFFRVLYFKSGLMPLLFPANIYSSTQSVFQCLYLMWPLNFSKLDFLLLSLSEPVFVGRWKCFIWDRIEKWQAAYKVTNWICWLTSTTLTREYSQNMRMITPLEETTLAINEESESKYESVLLEQRLFVRILQIDGRNLHRYLLFQ